MIRASLLVLCLCTALVGCRHTPAGVSPSTIPLEPGSYRLLNEVEGRDCLYSLFGLIPISGANTTNRVVGNP